MDDLGSECTPHFFCQTCAFRVAIRSIATGYQWINGTTYTQLDGTGPWFHTPVGSAASGCDSVAKLYINWNQIDDLTVSDNGVTLTSNTGPGSTYQWVNCDNNYAPIGITAGNVRIIHLLNTSRSSGNIVSSTKLHYTAFLDESHC